MIERGNMKGRQRCPGYAKPAADAIAIASDFRHGKASDQCFRSMAAPRAQLQRSTNGGDVALGRDKRNHARSKTPRMCVRAPQIDALRRKLHLEMVRRQEHHARSVANNNGDCA